MIVVRPATNQDLPALKRRQTQLLPDSPIDWYQRPEGRILLIAETPSSANVGHLLADRAKFENRQIVTRRVKGELPVPPWIKLQALAVDTSSQRSGVGNALYAELLNRVPKGTCGIYGNVAETSIKAVSFYRRHGFHVSASYHLTDRESRYRRGTPGIALVENPGYFFFHAWLPTAVRHTDVPPTATEEMQLATIEADRAAILREEVIPRRPDVGYRAFARAYVDEHGPECAHTAFGPRVLEGIGWDPQHQLNCSVCTRWRIPEIQRYDAENRCDGCDEVQPDVVLSWARADNHLVTAGLCSTCRGQVTATLPPPPR